MTSGAPVYAMPDKKLLHQVGRAIADFGMIREGDRVMLGLSGGKDSLSLLHILLHLRSVAPVNFDVAAMTVDPMSDSFDPSPLKDYIACLNIPYFYESQPIMDQGKKHMDGDSYCSWCARMKRGIMYSTARREGYNVIALAQHLDDLAESFLMSAFHGGQLRTMKAHYTISKGDLRVIRPLVYTREQQTGEFAQKNALPVIVENCPACFSMPTQRQHMKELLKEEEKHNSGLYGSILTSIKPLMSINTAD
ncbi:MAG TPA: tRNA 2-thiocytidine biosynthesis protein TtcA [Gammaproteobacteria bacterium]|nr:tRNA 2-thiocytidine biosynthesis protein TtcA [Gammaproteobacteria bacterium]